MQLFTFLRAHHTTGTMAGRLGLADSGLTTQFTKSSLGAWLLVVHNSQLIMSQTEDFLLNILRYLKESLIITLVLLYYSCLYLVNEQLWEDFKVEAR